MALADAPLDAPPLRSASGGAGEGMATTSLSLESNKAVPAPFLSKTYQLVDDPLTDHIVSWGDDFSTFVVWRPPEFARDILPSYFKHNNFSSFVRQLNTYGFRKIVPERWEFANVFFRKDEKHLLSEIHRRKTTITSTSPSQLPHPPLHLPFHHYHTHTHSNLHHPTAPSYLASLAGIALSLPLDADESATPSGWCDSVSSSSTARSAAAATTVLAEENETLRRANAALLSELGHMRKLYNDIIYFVQNHVRPVAPSRVFPSSLLAPPPPPHHHDHNLTLHFTDGSKACLNRSCTTSGSSLSVVEEPSPNNNNSCGNTDSNGGDGGSGGRSCDDDSNRNKGGRGGRPKLFGVPLGGIDNKRPSSQWDENDSSAPPATKPRLLHGSEDLGLSLGVSSPP